MRLRLRRLPLLAVTLTACAAPSDRVEVNRDENSAVTPPDATAPAAESLLSLPVREELDRRYPGWRFAGLSDWIQEQLHPGDSPESIRGDFDGDGRADYAVQVVHASAQDTLQHVIAYLPRDAATEAHVLETSGPDLETYLQVGRKGEQGRDVVADSAVHFQSDVIHVLYGQTAGVTYVWREGVFQRFVSGD